MSRRIIGPFNRVEGDLEVKVELSDGQVQDAWVTSPLFRGFEQMLEGKDPLDALVYVPRICGICSVAQSIAATTAIAQAQGLTPATNGQLAANIILANENITDHLTHFYLFFMPDFAREIYGRESWFQPTQSRFQAHKGSAAGDFLPQRAQFLHIMGILAGKWPHSLALQPGGSSRAVESQERTRLLALIYGCRRFLENTLYGDSLESFAELDSAAALNHWQLASSNGDLRHFLRLAEDLELAQLGKATGRFLSFGAYPIDNKPLFASGVWFQGKQKPLQPRKITEDISHSWMEAKSMVAHPYLGETRPSMDQPQGYTWCKAPRLDGQVVEVGALARQANDGHPLITDLLLREGGNVRTRIIARLLEAARLIPAMETWAKALRPKEAFCHQAPVPEDAEGAGLIEAARGSLGHWLRIRQGKLETYQIVAPTTWNFSPRDHTGTRGALEQALIGAPQREGETEPVAIQHIVRSFDPCMVCTVH